jgi:hypothetical protein
VDLVRAQQPRSRGRAGCFDAGRMTGMPPVRAGAFFIGAVAVLASGAALADAPICADRPGKASQVCTAPAGHFQLETSLVDWSVQKGGGSRDTALTLGETDIKFGLTDRSHIDVDVTPWTHVKSREGGERESASGFGDLLVTYKHQLTTPGASFGVALAPFVKAPTAKRSIGNGKWEAGLIAPIQYAIPNSTQSLSFTPELDWTADGDGHGHHAGAQSVANIGWQATKKLNLSAEIWGGWDWDPAGTVRQASVDGAIAYLVNDKVQIDTGANVGLNRNTPDLDVYVGIAKQF